MANENKNEKAGAATPATPSIVEGTQDTDQAKLDLAPKTSYDEVEKLKADLADKDVEIEALKVEREGVEVENEKLKADLADKDVEIEALKVEREGVEVENEKLKADLAKASKQSKAVKSGAPKFVVISAFRGTQKNEGIFEIDADVSHFDADRLKDLVSRELVKEVK
ncbi:hypothetical protein E2P86_08545 [Sphingobacterium psychroaquaticum]|uniref:hypothetical protein n=1 Tax=Sphingobacterium psychroaquaticum TaxID=561061 RepID=UPI00106D329B|nr:hypothetical protein [Sphingobacterium psychroaquaticum]QBQ41202.1 hypothetical protein E2P86_08545 [Sphingobacterium psychroaquaticum]